MPYGTFYQMRGSDSRLKGRRPSPLEMREPETIAFHIIDQNTTFLFPDKRKKALHAAIAQALRDEQDRSEKLREQHQEAFRKLQRENQVLRDKIRDQEGQIALNPCGRAGKDRTTGHQNAIR